MFYKIGTGRELDALQGKFHPAVIAHLKCCINILDDAYGADRDYLQSGGYAVIAETCEDLVVIYEHLDLENHPCEWAKKLDGGYASALYLLNDDFAVVVILPLELIPDVIKQELEVEL